MGPQARGAISFTVLDDALLAAPDRADHIRQVLVSRPVAGLGPALEYAFQQARYPAILPVLASLPPSATSNALLQVLLPAGQSRQLHSTSFDPLTVEFAMLRYRDSALEGTGWVAYLQRLKNAAKRSGFGDSTAKGLVGAVKELVENVDLHSEAPDSSVVGYASGDHAFEFAIADTGIGVLESLRRCSDYEHLSDHGDALHTALTDGESRFGRNTNHGRGFRQIFVALADLYGSLRFRSGDHRLEIEGRSPNLPTATVSQTSVYQGLMVWVACRPAPPRIVGLTTPRPAS